MEAGGEAMKWNKPTAWIVAVPTMLIASYALLPAYLQNSIRYLFPGIQDHRIFENREVKANSPIPWELASDYMQHSLLKSERDTLEHYKSVAYLIIQNNAIVYEEYWDGYGPGSLSNSFSAAKSIVGLLIGVAIDEGLIEDVEQAVGDFIPEYNTPPNKQLKIKHLLTMSSGLNWNESYANPFSITTKAYYGKKVNQLVKNLTVIETPGKEFHYKSGDTQLLSLILKKATGKSLSAYASEKLWTPLGAEKAALWSLDKNRGDEKAYCCFNSNARDFARLGKLILNNGMMNGKQLVPTKYIKESISPARHLVHHEDKKPVDFYGYQWWILHHEGDTIPYARGIYGQYIFALKNHNAVVVRLGHERNNRYINHHPAEIFSYVSTAKRILEER
ncbi:CubicO group peptidase, beta-lactamase class C family [Saccharicrinis carchari]|uniref:CubicO group peptidase, beta-lactamase class C family n=1 Tax=Saccharicrinis carchari TaxID=1168039 RepID=A0A521DHH1_SACCC|nr:serine hydrolase [Saccharicrinis carchari]SMO71163.1 CubicO group peptidase, beta-lactamase class C family [Saccharicrinis carchari]